MAPDDTHEDQEGSTNTPLTQLISTIAQALVDDPDSVEVQEIDEGDGALIELRVAPDDIGKVIGKEGRTAQSMRAILMAASSKMGRRAHLDILD
ncbi:MAG TPA: KH domain-containing protein [Polyangiaceae bacterium]|nr:KH domain-containing protein [Polyangiaceae bacterium]